MYTPSKVKDAIKNLGSQIQMARKRRMWTIADLATKIGVSAPTVIALEKGKPTVSLGVLFSCLWILGLEKELSLISHPTDEEGIKLMNLRLPQKVRTNRKHLNNDF